MQGLIRLLSTCASGSPLGAKTLLLLGISGILKDILSGSGLVASLSVSAALSRPPEQVLTVTLFKSFFLIFLNRGLGGTLEPIAPNESIIRIGNLMYFLVCKFGETRKKKGRKVHCHGTLD